VVRRLEPETARGGPALAPLLVTGEIVPRNEFQGDASVRIAMDAYRVPVLSVHIPFRNNPNRFLEFSNAGVSSQREDRSVLRWFAPFLRLFRHP
jgi:hypothetical protein